MISALIQLDFFIKLSHFAINACTDKSFLVEFLELLFEFAFPSADDRGEDHHTFAFGEVEDAKHDLLDRLTRDGLAALMTVRLADRREQQAEIVVNFRDGADG